MWRVFSADSGLAAAVSGPGPLTMRAYFAAPSGMALPGASVFNVSFVEPSSGSSRSTGPLAGAYASPRATQARTEPNWSVPPLRVKSMRLPSRNVARTSPCSSTTRHLPSLGRTETGRPAGAGPPVGPVVRSTLPSVVRMPPQSICGSPASSHTIPKAPASTVTARSTTLPRGRLAQVATATASASATASA